MTARPTTRAKRREYALTHPSAQHRAANGEIIGFLKPRHNYCVTAKWSDGRKEERHMTNKREATRAFEMLTKHSKEADGKYAGAAISLACDGKEI